MKRHRGPIPLRFVILFWQKIGTGIPHLLGTQTIFSLLPQQSQEEGNYRQTCWWMTAVGKMPWLRWVASSRGGNTLCGADLNFKSEMQFWGKRNAQARGAIEAILLQRANLGEEENFKEKKESQWWTKSSPSDFRICTVVKENEGIDGWSYPVHKDKPNNLSVTGSVETLQTFLLEV